MSGCTVFADKTALAGHAAAQWLERLAKHDAGRPFTVALSGGRIPRLLYDSVVELARPSVFENVHFFWGDERVVPPTDNGSNFKHADDGLFRPLQIPPGQVHRVQTERSETEAVQLATDELLRFTNSQADGQPVIDLVFLGMGEDAHVASLFPGDTEAIESRAVYRAVTGSKPPPRRITLGYPALAASREVWVLASGEGKAEALRTSLAKGGDTPLARVLQSREHTEILTDFKL
ncbi:MAG: 6-phosphogluconolactonase [Verrucomicrobiota bacterium]|mgnify:FL=1|nr:6-phosphogluconolactonase [Verrucomicrobiota bacterium]MDP7292650.1 6-phosphogluconolactonase [Verrucomicrobiota bacterium]